MLASSTSSYTHNYFFLFEFLFNLVCFYCIFVYVPFSTFPFAQFFLCTLFTNISFRIHLPLPYHTHLILLFLYTLTSSLFPLQLSIVEFFVFLFSPFKIYLYSETCLKRNMDIAETVLSTKLLQSPVSAVLRIQNSSAHM
jgi:hypothetical protein